jgi:hypothetical protein
VWPVACYVGCRELLTWMRENLGASKVVVKAASAGASKPVASEPPKPDAPQETVIDLIKAAEERFPEAKTGGKIPALRLIQGELGIGAAEGAAGATSLQSPRGGGRIAARTRTPPRLWRWPRGRLLPVNRGTVFYAFAPRRLPRRLGRYLRIHLWRCWLLPPHPVPVVVVVVEEEASRGVFPGLRRPFRADTLAGHHLPPRVHLRPHRDSCGV